MSRIAYALGRHRWLRRLVQAGLVVLTVAIIFWLF